jgi:transposase
MSTSHVSTQVSRYVALDVHRSYLVVGAVDSLQHIVLSPRRFGARSFCHLGSRPFE